MFLPFTADRTNFTADLTWATADATVFATPDVPNFVTGFAGASSGLVWLLGFDYRDPRSTEMWALQHAADHDQIREGIQKQTLGNPTDWVLYPVNWRDWDAYALRHQSEHNEMNDSLGLSGTDLTAVDFRNLRESEEWHFQHYREHQAARAKLGI